jgi:hypothetical protein
MLMVGVCGPRGADPGRSDAPAGGRQADLAAGGTSCTNFAGGSSCPAGACRSQSDCDSSQPCVVSFVTIDSRETEPWECAGQEPGICTPLSLCP